MTVSSHEVEAGDESCEALSVGNALEESCHKLCIFGHAVGLAGAVVELERQTSRPCALRLDVWCCHDSGLETIVVASTKRESASVDASPCVVRKSDCCW